jgi:hypothetical protein
MKRLIAPTPDLVLRAKFSERIVVVFFPGGFNLNFRPATSGHTR